MTHDQCYANAQACYRLAASFRDNGDRKHAEDYWNRARALDRLGDELLLDELGVAAA